MVDGSANGLEDTSYRNQEEPPTPVFDSVEDISYNCSVNDNELDKYAFDSEEEDQDNCNCCELMGFSFWQNKSNALERIQVYSLNELEPTPLDPPGKRAEEDDVAEEDVVAEEDDVAEEDVDPVENMGDDAQVKDVVSVSIV